MATRSRRRRSLGQPTTTPSSIATSMGIVSVMGRIASTSCGCSRPLEAVRASASSALATVPILDAERLATDFSEVHLIDVDAEALERGRESFPPDARDRVVTHAGIDLSGFQDRIDEWGDRFPDNAELGRAAVASIHSILRQIGRPFHVVLSDCILSQLPIAYRRAWVSSRTNWNNLFTAITAVHLGTLVGSLERGGRGAIACDALGSKTAPELRELGGATPEELQRFVKDGLAQGKLALDPDPASLLAGLAVPGLRELVDSPQVTQPWLWDTGDILLVYGLLFRRT